MFWLIYVTFCGSNAGTETFAPLINVIVNNALFHSNSHINQMLSQIIHILRFFSGRLAAIGFVVNCIEVGLFGGQKIGKFILLHFSTGDWRQRVMHVMLRKR